MQIKGAGDVCGMCAVCTDVLQFKFDGGRRDVQHVKYQQLKYDKETNLRWALNKKLLSVTADETLVNKSTR